MMPFGHPLHRRSPAFRRRLSLAFAAAENRLTEVHADQAAKFARELAADLPFDLALQIFHRLVGVPGHARRAVTTRALTLLHESVPDHLLAARIAVESPHGPVDRLRRRLRGRLHHDLRLRVRAAVASTHHAVRAAYLAGAADAIAATDPSIPAAEAVQLFIDALDIQPGWAEIVFHDALAADSHHHDDRAAA